MRHIHLIIASLTFAYVVYTIHPIEPDMGALCVKDNRLKVLVTGSAGFIGMHVSEHLVKKGFMVVGLDNLNDYYPVSLKRSRMLRLNVIGVTTIVTDINDVSTVERAFQSCKFSYVIHLAAQAGVRYARLHPLTYVDSNIRGTVALFEVCRRQDTPPIIVYASSSSVYGRSREVPFSEDGKLQPASLYAASKLAVEHIADVYNYLYHITAIGLRFFTVYGPWGRPDMSIMSFTREFMRNGSITIFQDDEGRDLSRDFTYISDIVDGIVKAAVSAPKSIPGSAIHRIYNLGNSEPQTVSSLCTQLRLLLKRTATIIYRQSARDEVSKTHANISRAMAELQYKPHTSFEVGLTRFIEWYKTYYGYQGIDVNPSVAVDEKLYVPQ